VLLGRTKMNGEMMSSPRKRSRTELAAKATIVLGAQWGDEGKGKVVDMLATDADIVCRCQVSKIQPSYRLCSPLIFLYSAACRCI